jgi:hypothetical protein
VLAPQPARVCERARPSLRGGAGLTRDAARCALGGSQRLSEEEKEFATGYLNALEQHLREAFLARLPDKFQSFVSAQEGMVDEPDLDSYVALRVHEDLGPVPISADGEETVELHRSDLLFAPYRPFRALLEQNKVDLV